MALEPVVQVAAVPGIDKRHGRGHPRVLELWKKASAPIDALPVDLFRVAVGLLALGYLLAQLALAPSFTVPGGLIDHELIRRIYPYTKLSLFWPGMGAAGIYAALLAGCACAVAVAAGWRVKANAAVLWLITASLSRWNFPLMQVDDTTVQLFVFWLLLLPVGGTLTWEGWRRRGRAAWGEWLDARVPGLAARCLLANVCLAYFVAGTLKLASPMWRSGFALYASLRLPIAYFPDAWGPGAVPFLRVLCWTALAVELSLPFLLTRPRGSRLKTAGLVCQAGFHLGIASLLALPAANLGLLSSALLFFGPELTGFLRRRARRAAPPRRAAARGWGERVAPVFLVLLAVSVFRWYPGFERVSRAATAALWVAGVYEDYSLFNWIDEKNLRGDPELTLLDSDGRTRPLALGGVFPRSMRSALLQGYLFGDIEQGSLWIGVPYGDRPALRRGLLTRMASRFCRESGVTGTVRVCASLARITPDNAGLKTRTRLLLMDARCRDGEPVWTRTFVSGPFPPPCPDPAWKGRYVPAGGVMEGPR